MVSRRADSAIRPGDRSYTVLIAALFAAGIATFAQLYSTQAILPEIARDLGVSPIEASLTVSASTLGLAVAVFAWVPVARRLGYARTMTISLLGGLLFGAIGITSTTLEAFLVFRALEGAALAAVPALAVSYLVSRVDRSVVTAAAAAYVSGTTIGGLAGRLISTPAAYFSSWRLGVLAVEVVSIAAIVVFVLCLRYVEGRMPVAEPAPEGDVKTDAADPSEVALGAAASDFRIPARPAGARLRLLALGTQPFLLMGVFVAFYNFLPFRLQEAPFDLSTLLTSAVFLVYLVGTVTARAVATLVARTSRPVALMISIAALLAGIGVSLSDQLGVVIVGVALLTGGFFAAHSLVSSWIVVAAPAGAGPLASSWYTVSYYAGSAVLGAGLGTVYVASGWLPFALALTAIAVLAALIAVVLLRPVSPADSSARAAEPTPPRR